LFDLTINHLLSKLKLCLCSSFNSVHSHLVHLEFLFSELFNASFLLKFFLSCELRGADLISICLHNVSLDASSLLLALELADLLTL